MGCPDFGTSSFARRLKSLAWTRTSQADCGAEGFAATGLTGWDLAIVAEPGFASWHFCD